MFLLCPGIWWNPSGHVFFTLETSNAGPWSAAEALSETVGCKSIPNSQLRMVYYNNKKLRQPRNFMKCPGPKQLPFVGVWVVFSVEEFDQNSLLQISTPYLCRAQPPIPKPQPAPPSSRSISLGLPKGCGDFFQ